MILASLLVGDSAFARVAVLGDSTLETLGGHRHGDIIVISEPTRA
jgi:hypothetical protein